MVTSKFPDQFSFGTELIKFLEYDNCCKMVYTRDQWLRLTEGLAEMRENGFEFTSDNAEELVAGEVNEVKKLFGNIPGFDKVDKVLNEIFDGP